MSDLRGQLTVRGVVLGCVGCAVISAASVYTALKMGALPWPIIFAAIVSLFVLRAVSGGRAGLNEANVTHTVMSSGAMVAGGLAFTIPGAWMCGLSGEISFWQMLLCALAGSALGLLGCVCLRRHFIDDASLEFPIGAAAARTLVAGDTGGATGAKLFGSLGFAAVYAFLRDWVGALPTTFANLAIPGVSFCIYNSPMMLSVGFLVGTTAVCTWFAGAVIANFGIIVGLPALGIMDAAAAAACVSCLGMGVMMGSGIGVIVRDIVPKFLRRAQKKAGSSGEGRGISGGAGAAGVAGLGEVAQVAIASEQEPAMPQKSYCAMKKSSSADIALTAGFAGTDGSLSPDNSPCASPSQKATKARVAAVFVVVCACIAACLALGLPFWVAAVCVVLGFVTCAMSAQSVGQTGIDPMEIFGLIVLLGVAAVGQIAQVKLFFVAALVACACGLAGDVMNDFKAGAMLGTSPRAQWVGQAIGAFVGSVVAVCVMQVLLSAYGPDAFGVGAEFVSAQASVVAAMVSGISQPVWFAAGLILGLVLYVVRFPAMMLGLGIYLPFYMSFTAFLGAMCKVVFDGVMRARARRRRLEGAQLDAYFERAQETGLLVASGLLGGESIMGIIIALVTAGCALF